MRTWGSILAIVGLGILVGGMLFFGAVMAPLVFTHLPLPEAGAFIRAAFPWYYGFTLASAALAALGFLLQHRLRAAAVPGRGDSHHRMVTALAAAKDGRTEGGERFRRVQLLAQYIRLAKRRGTSRGAATADPHSCGQKPRLAASALPG